MVFDFWEAANSVRRQGMFNFILEKCSLTLAQCGEQSRAVLGAEHFPNAGTSSCRLSYVGQCGKIFGSRIGYLLAKLSAYGTLYFSRLLYLSRSFLGNGLLLMHAFSKGLSTVQPTE